MSLPRFAGLLALLLLIGLPLSAGAQARIAVAANFAEAARQLADDYAGDITRQTAETLASIERLLAEAGSDKSRLLAVTIHLADLADYAGMNAVWDAWLPAGCAPARTCVEAKLYDPRARVEMTVVAAQR